MGHILRHEPKLWTMPRTMRDTHDITVTKTAHDRRYLESDEEMGYD